MHVSDPRRHHASGSSQRPASPLRSARLGSHDDRAALESVFGGTPHLGDRCRDVVDGEVTLVVLDSLDDRPGTDHVSGWLGEEQRAWLDDVLAARRDRRAVLALHHPPAPIGIPFLDGMRLRDADALAEVVARNPQIVRVLAGHVHRPVTTGSPGRRSPPLRAPSGRAL